MYSKYNMAQNYPIMYQPNKNYYGNVYNSGDRFIPGTVLAPFLLGGVAGYAINNNNNNTRPNFYPYYYNNFYYPQYPYFY